MNSLFALLAVLCLGYVIGWRSGRAAIASDVERFGNFSLKKRIYIVRERFDVGVCDGK